MMKYPKPISPEFFFFSDLKILKALKYSFIADFAYGQKGKKVTSFSSGVEA